MLADVQILGTLRTQHNTHTIENDWMGELSLWKCKGKTRLLIRNLPLDSWHSLFPYFGLC